MRQTPLYELGWFLDACDGGVVGVIDSLTLSISKWVKRRDTLTLVLFKLQRSLTDHQVVVIGHVDSGKSTTTGHLIYSKSLIKDDSG